MQRFILSLWVLLATVAAVPSRAQKPDTIPMPRPDSVRPLSPDMMSAQGDSVAIASRRTATGPLRLVADLSERQLYVMRGDQVVRTSPIAIGTLEFPTPEGSFAIRRLSWNPRWVPPDSEWAKKKRPRGPGDLRNPMGKVKIFFRQPDYYIHGTREVDSLGKAESHGCLRMSNPAVVSLARLVMEEGGEARSPEWWRRVLNRVTRTHEVYLSRPIAIEVRA